MKYKSAIAWLCVSLLSSVEVAAENFEISGLTISKIRAVGNYSGDTFDDTLELWFTTPLVFPANFPCTATGRVEIDKVDQHVVSAAYMAFASGKKVNVNIDTILPIRGGTCQVSYLDVIN